MIEDTRRDSLTVKWELGILCISVFMEEINESNNIYRRLCKG